MKKKLKLKDLAVQSFVTSFEKDEKQTIIGGVGGGASNANGCDTKGGACQNTQSVFCNPTKQTRCFVCG